MKDKLVKLFIVLLYLFFELFALFSLSSSSINLVSVFVAFLFFGVSAIYVCFAKLKIFKFSFGKVLFSLFCCLVYTFANYTQWYLNENSVNNLIFVINLIVVFFGVYWTLVFLECVEPRLNLCSASRIRRAALDFIIPFCIIAIVYLVTYFRWKNGGCLSADSWSQISQASSGEIFNHHPAYHTMILRGLILASKAFLPQMNQLTLYFIIQILFMATCFSFSIYTLRQLNIRIGWLIGLLIFYCAFPFHIVYSMTLWKDVPFAGFVFLSAICLTRLVKNVAKREWCDWTFLVFSQIGVCLFRPNGIIAVTIFFICSIVILYKVRTNLKNKHSNILKITICVASSLAIGLILYYPVLSLLKIGQEGFEEGLSVPLQQFNKAVYTYHDLTEDEVSIIENSLGEDTLNNYYYKGNADLIKAQLFTKNNLYFEEHLGDYVWIYLKEGARHPFTYITAFVDQTVGFWNAGYNCETNCGLIYNRVNTFTEEINDWLDWLIQLFLTNPVLCVFNSVGLYFWILLALAAICIFRKQALELLPIALLLSILLTVILSTPLWSEYRYAYFLFCSVPFVALALLSSPHIELHQKPKLSDNTVA